MPRNPTHPDTEREPQPKVLKYSFRRARLTAILPIVLVVIAWIIIGLPRAPRVEIKRAAVTCADWACSGRAVFVGELTGGASLRASGELTCKTDDGFQGEWNDGWVRSSAWDSARNIRVPMYVNCNGDVALVNGVNALHVFSGGMALYEVKSGVLGVSYKYGYLDDACNVAIPPRFDAAHDFHEGLAAVNVGASNWNRGAIRGGKWGFIDKTGEFVIPPRFGGVRDFSEGLAAVVAGPTCGYIDSSGEWVIEPTLRVCDEFSEGLAHVRSGDDKALYIGRDAQVVIEGDFDLCLPFREGLAAVQDAETEQWGFIDRSGAWAIPPQFYWAESFHEGRAGVAKGIDSEDGRVGLWGYIDRAGEILLERRFLMAKPFVNGIGIVYEGEWAHSKVHFVDIDGDFIRPRL